jgi:hypothetical protein
MEPEDWKDQILEKEFVDVVIPKSGSFAYIPFEIPLQEGQREMLLKVLSEDFYISNEMEKSRIRVIVDNGFYYEWDKGCLNGIRGLYLKGVNWIK